MPSSKDPEINRQKAREYRLAHPDWHRKANREWAAKKWATDPAYRAKRLEQRRRAWSAKTPEEKAERALYQKEWFAQNEGYNRRKLAESYKAKPARHMLWRAKTRAEKLGVAFDLAVDDVVIPELCPALGVPLVLGDGTFRGPSPSLDRLVPERGYVRGNVRVISHQANLIKHNRSLANMREYVEGLRLRHEAALGVLKYMERELAE